MGNLHRFDHSSIDDQQPQGYADTMLRVTNQQREPGQDLIAISPAGTVHRITSSTPVRVRCGPRWDGFIIVDASQVQPGAFIEGL